MARTSLKYEQPSRASQLLVLGFSVAVAFMTGWLVLTILLGNSGSTMVSTSDDEVPAMATKQPPRVESPRVAASAPIVQPPQLLSPQADPGAWPGTASTGATAAPASAATAAPAARTGAAGPALASLPGPPAVSAPATVPAASSQFASVSGNDRVAVGDIYAQVTNKIEDGPADAPEMVPLPPHRPRPASVPYPRPRPQLEEQAQVEQPKSFLDFFMNSGSR
jgi:hypothetical protein